MFTAADVIFSYSRAQAIDDGVLVDLTAWAKQSKADSPSIVITSAGWAECLARRDGETAYDEEARVDALLVKVRDCITTLQPDEVQWVNAPNELGEPVRLQVHGGGGDNGEFVVTVMLEGED